MEGLCCLVPAAIVKLVATDEWMLIDGRISPQVPHTPGRSVATDEWMLIDGRALVSGPEGSGKTSRNG